MDIRHPTRVKQKEHLPKVVMQTIHELELHGPKPRYEQYKLDAHIRRNHFSINNSSNHQHTIFSILNSTHSSKLQSPPNPQCGSSRFLLSLLSPPWLPLRPSLLPRLLLPRLLWLLLWQSPDSVGHNTLNRSFVTYTNTQIGSLLFKALRKGADI